MYVQICMYVAKRYLTKYIYVCLGSKIPWTRMYIAKYLMKKKEKKKKQTRKRNKQIKKHKRQQITTMDDRKTESSENLDKMGSPKQSRNNK